MSIQAITRYQAVCDRCGKEDYGIALAAEDVPDLLGEDWIIHDDGKIACDWCLKADQYDACERDGGHVFDTEENAWFADLWADDENGECIRKCRDCRCMERRINGSDWYGYRHGEWLGDQESG